MGKKDGKPQRESCNRHKIKIDNCPGCPDCRQRQLAFHIAYNKRIRPVIELLEDTAENKRKAEFQQGVSNAFLIITVSVMHLIHTSCLPSHKKTVCRFSLAYGRCPPGSCT